MTENTATKGKTLTNMRGDAAVYRLNPPLDEAEYVVVSAVDLPVFFPGDRSSETMIFPCINAEGDDIDYGELAMVPYKSHVDALADIDYVIA